MTQYAKQKIYAYVDESGQDNTSKFFVVVAVLISGNRYTLRSQLINIESESRTHGIKWHRTRRDRRLRYLTLVLQRRIAFGNLYFGRYRKPIQYFFPMIDVLEHAIKHSAKKEYRANIYVDGIDKNIARKLTSAIRARRISLRLVQGKRDESEPLIRLADMWAGCIRGALKGGDDSKVIFKKAIKNGYLKEITI
jgi:hypothetical protein